MLLLVLSTIFYSSYWLLSHITVVETMDSAEREINPLLMTFINRRKKNRRAGDRASNLLFFSPVRYRLSLTGSADETTTVRNMNKD